MPDHYFAKQPQSAHDLRTITLPCGERTLTCHTDAGVFSRDHLDPGSALLLSAVSQGRSGDWAGQRVLDLGCGWGPVGLTLACRYPMARLVLCDINERALELARDNFASNGAQADFFAGDGLEDVPGDFDLILTNPPIRAGKAVIYRFFAQGSQRLRPGGALYIVIRKQQGAPSALTYLRTLFDRAEVVDRDAGYWIIACTNDKGGTPTHDHV